MNELIAISALIGDRTYRIKINPADEEVVRKTLKTINEKILEFKTHFAGKDMQDYIAMVILWFATQQPSVVEGSLTEEGTASLARLESLLDKALE